MRAEPIGGQLLGSHGVIVPAGAPALPRDITARGWLVADLDTGAVLGARDPHGRYLPASTLKTLTALTLLPRLTDRHRLVTATNEDCTVDGTRVGLVPKGRYPVEMLFQCMLMMSGNDCAGALAEAYGGIPQTLAAMNAEATRLHAEDTHAATPSGLDGPHQSSSPYDLALILRQDLALPDFRRYNTTLRSRVPAQPPKYGPYEFANDNSLLRNYPGVLGAKNGFTDDARHTFVAAVQKGDRRLVVTLMHGEQRPVPMWQQAARLIEWGLRVPATATPVGQLVEPGGPTPGRPSGPGQPGAPAPNQAPVTANASTAPNRPRWLPIGLAGTAAAAVLSGMAIRLRRRRQRRGWWQG